MTTEAQRTFLGLLRLAAGQEGAAELVREQLVRGVCDLFLARARQEGLSGLLADFAEGWGIRLPLADEVDRLLADKRKYRLELFRLQEALGKSGHQMLVLKGAALGASVYSRHDPRWRPWRDLDLLVQEGGYAAARAMLLELGYRDEPSGYLLDTLCIDLHRDVLGASRIPSRNRVFRFPAELLWPRCRPLHPGLPNLRVMMPEHQYCHLAVHAMKHSYSRLIWLLDLALLYPTLDSEEVWAAAGEFGARRCLVLSWRALADLLDVPLREADRARIPRLGVGERLFLRWLKEGRQPSVMGELLCVMQAPGWSARANYMRELFFPPGQTASVSARLRHLAAMARDELRRLLGGGPSR